MVPLAGLTGANGNNALSDEIAAALRAAYDKGVEDSAKIILPINFTQSGKDHAAMTAERIRTLKSSQVADQTEALVG